ncbi:MAG: hypothetical protein ACTSRG_06260 [Candidatus Helarchaeota archaeon]
MSTDTEKEIIKIKRTRYLIPCKCKICKKKFKDIILATRHINQTHKERKSNIIENLEWNLEIDNKNWKILNDIEEKRSKILWDLYDDDTILTAKVPKIIKIGKEEYRLRNLVEGLEKLDKSKLDKVIDNLKRRVTRYMDSLTGEKYFIGDDVILPKSKRAITKIGNELEKILGIKKAYLFLTNSNLKKKLEQSKTVLKPASEKEEEELEDEEDLEDLEDLEGESEEEIED